MIVLGVRCSNSDFTYVVMTGTKQSPVLSVANCLKLPKNYGRPRCLLWFQQEIDQLIKKHGIRVIVIKRSEGGAGGDAFEHRIEHEATIYLAAAQCGVSGVFKKKKCTLAKDLGLKGRAHYLRTALDTSVIPRFDERPEKEQEAIFCAWSELG